MIDDINTRYSQIFIDGEWRTVPNLAVKKGMRFRMFEPEGTLVIDGIAETDAEMDDKGIIGIQVGKLFEVETHFSIGENDEGLQEILE